MEKIIKFFPFLPAVKDSTNFWLVLAFYQIVPGVAAGILSGLLIWTIIGPAVIVAAAGAYSTIGLILVVLTALDLYKPEF